MLTLRVVDYYDLWLGERKRAVLMEKGEALYDASGLFTKLQDFEIRNMHDVKVLFEEKVNYCDKSIEEQAEFLNEIQTLEKKYGIKQFGGIKAKHHWMYVNGVTHIRAYS